MNKVIFLSIVFFLFLAKGLFAQFDMKEAIKGEGEVVRQEISLAPISGIDLGISGDVILTPGNTQRIVIEGQQNIIDNIKREVKDGSWKIYSSRNIKEAKRVTIYITLPTIAHLGLSGSGEVRSNGRFTELKDLEVAVSGSGDITFDGDANETNVHLSGSGEVTLSGSTRDLEISISGSGNVSTVDLPASGCHVNISGSGDAQVFVNGELKANISGSGNIRYAGNASVTARISGSGEVSKI